MKPITKQMQTAKRNKKVNVKRVKESEYKRRQNFCRDKEVCQVCDISRDLDCPHHADFGGYKKDDRTLINICCDCHRAIHTKGFDSLNKTREETVAIGWANNEEFLNAQN